MKIKKLITKVIVTLILTKQITLYDNLECGW